MTISASRAPLFELFDEGEKARLFANIAAAMGDIPEEIEERQCRLFDQVHPDYGAGVRAARITFKGRNPLDLGPDRSVAGGRVSLNGSIENRSPRVGVELVEDAVSRGLAMSRYEFSTSSNPTRPRTEKMPPLPAWGVGRFTGIFHALTKSAFVMAAGRIIG